MKAPLALLLLTLASAAALQKPGQPTARSPFGVTPRPGSPAPTDSAGDLQIGNDPRIFFHVPGGAGLTVLGAESELDDYSHITVTFPTAMVSPEALDGVVGQSPIAIWPDLDTEFIWTTPQQGYLTVAGPRISGQTYRFRLREGLKDLSGAALDTEAWGVEMTAPAFQVTEDYGQRNRLNARPQVPLTFNYPVRLEDAARGAWFQDRVTRERFPAEILLNRSGADIPPLPTEDRPLPEGEKVYDVRVRPLEPLPVGRMMDLVVEGIRDATAGRGLPYPRVFPLGRTHPLEIAYVVATNYPLQEPRIEVKFSEVLGDGSLPENPLVISPEVPDLRFRKEGAYLIASGKFQVGTRYTVTVSDKIPGFSGYTLPEPEKWGASVRPTPPTVLFPAGTVRQRSALGMRFSFYQIHTGELSWKLARVPLDKLPAVMARNKEFTENKKDAEGFAIWNKEGFLQQATTEELIPAFGLEVVATGSVAAAEESSGTLREISWQPESSEILSGPMLLEMSGPTADGRLVGNRALIYFGHTAITRKVSATETVLRVARMSTGEPVAGSRVTAHDNKMEEIGRGITDREGLVTFAQDLAARAVWYQADEDGATTLQPVALSDKFPSGYPTTIRPPPYRSFSFTDRPLYRPGQEISFKGLVRSEKEGRLEIPKGTKVEWSIESGYGSEVFATGKTTIDRQGGWNGTWTSPADGPIGTMTLKASVDGIALAPAAEFQIEEFRNPLFSVVCQQGQAKAPAEAVVEVQSQYFHGAPNATAAVRWTATWYGDSSDGYYNGDDDMVRVDLHSEHAPRNTFSAEVSGEAALDKDGQVTLRCQPPFPDSGNRAYCHVQWRVDVTGPNGQTLTGGLAQQVPMAPVLLGVKVLAASGDSLVFRWDAETPFGSAPAAVQATLFQVVTKSAKERLAPDVYRYRNFDQFVSVDHRDHVTENSLTFQPREPGRYVLVVAPLPGNEGMPVSEEAYLAGGDPSEVPVDGDTAAKVFSLTGGRTPEDAAWKVGETAALTVLSPTGGVAWVSVETDHILDTFTLPIEGNTTRIEIPVKPNYEPNVHVSVYILRPGGTDQLAGEMFGSTDLAVIAPNRTLDLAVTVKAETFTPRETVSGQVRVTAAGEPVAGADLAIYAVDDSILELGGWERPHFLNNFFPQRPFGVATYSALDAYVDQWAPSRLREKGFVIGDGGDGEFGNLTFTRKDFKPILFWHPNVTTNARGEASFSCKAPDNLTRFRVIAIGQTKNSQFGTGDATFTVSKNLLIDPALPRFVREGDEIELRAVARQKLSENDTLTVRCTVEGALELLSEPKAEVSAGKDAPAIVRFRAKATAVGSATVKFDVVSTRDAQLTDSVEVTLPVAEPVILKRESVAGLLPQGSFALREVAPASWKDGTGTFRLAVSTTPWLSKLIGLPYLLDYPHGCLEQQTSRLLACTRLGALLDYLPEAKARRKNYENVITETFKVLEASLLPNDLLPYWPQGAEPNDFVTIQAAWCVAGAEAAGFDVPSRLASELPGTLEMMVTGQSRRNPSPSLRAFAIFVLTQFEGERSEAVRAAAEELYLRRDHLTGEGRAFLALALHAMEIAPKKQKQLIAELPETFDGMAFQPTTFASATRAEALCTWARLTIQPDRSQKKLKQRLNTLMESSTSLSTQENLWLLVAFQSLIDSSPNPSLKIGSIQPVPSEASANGSGVAWAARALTDLADLVVTRLPRQKVPGSYVLTATYSDGQRNPGPESQGMHADRSIKNLTDPARTGTESAPFRLGDQLLISYRLSSEKSQSYVALEDLLPAGIEVVNPNLALFGKHFSLPELSGGPILDASHVQMRDQETNVYFDSFPAGGGAYAVLARATAAGHFIWPPTQIQPMYDSRIFGRSSSGSCTIVSED
jgi:alpha-2-macroglobulin